MNKLLQLKLAKFLIYLSLALGIALIVLASVDYFYFKQEYKDALVIFSLAIIAIFICGAIAFYRL